MMLKLGVKNNEIDDNVSKIDRNQQQKETKLKKMMYNKKKNA